LNVETTHWKVFLKMSYYGILCHCKSQPHRDCYNHR